MITISQAEPKDLPVLSNIFINSFANTSFPVTKNPKLIREVLEQYLSELFLVAFDGSAQVGFACSTENLKALKKKTIKASLKWIFPWRSYFFSPLHAKYSDKPFILYLIVDPKYQNKGIGTKLFKETEKEMRKRKIREIYFQILAENKPIVELCSKIGCDFIDSVGLLNKCLIGKKEI